MIKETVLVTVRLETQVAWKAILDSEGTYVAACDSLGLTAVGDSWRELEETIDEVMDLHLRGLVERGELQRFLTQHGWSVMAPIPQERFSVRPERLRFDVPKKIERLTDVAQLT